MHVMSVNVLLSILWNFTECICQIKIYVKNCQMKKYTLRNMVPELAYTLHDAFLSCMDHHVTPRLLGLHRHRHKLSLPLALHCEVVMCPLHAQFSPTQGCRAENLLLFWAWSWSWLRLGCNSTLHVMHSTMYPFSRGPDTLCKGY